MKELETIMPEDLLVNLQEENHESGSNEPGSGEDDNKGNKNKTKPDETDDGVPKPEDLLNEGDGDNEDDENKGGNTDSDLKEVIKSIMDFEDGEIEDISDPEELLSKAVDKKTHEVLTNLPPDLRIINRMVLDGVPLEKAVEEVTKGVSSLGVDSLDPEDEKDAQKLVSKLLKAKGIEDDIIEETIEAYKASGKLKDAAVKAKEKLEAQAEKEKKDLEELPKKIQEKQKQMIDENVKTFSEFLNSKKEVAGFKLDDADAKDLPAYLFKPTVYYNGKKITKFHKDLLEIYADKEKTAALAKIIKSGLDVRKLKDIKQNKDNKYNKNLSREKEKKGGLDLAKFLFD